MNTLHDVVGHLHKDLDPIALSARSFMMSIPSLRMAKLGWEAHVSNYDHRMLCLLAEQTADKRTAINLVAIARMKAKGSGDHVTASMLGDLLEQP